jgi:hypothetical protein
MRLQELAFKTVEHDFAGLPGYEIVDGRQD